MAQGQCSVARRARPTPWCYSQARARTRLSSSLATSITAMLPGDGLPVITISWPGPPRTSADSPGLPLGGGGGASPLVGSGGLSAALPLAPFAGGASAGGASLASSVASSFASSLASPSALSSPSGFHAPVTSSVLVSLPVLASWSAMRVPLSSRNAQLASSTCTAVVP